MGRRRRRPQGWDRGSRRRLGRQLRRGRRRRRGRAAALVDVVVRRVDGVGSPRLQAAWVQELLHCALHVRAFVRGVVAPVAMVAKVAPALLKVVDAHRGLARRAWVGKVRQRRPPLHVFPARPGGARNVVSEVSRRAALNCVQNVRGANVQGCVFSAEKGGLQVRAASSCACTVFDAFVALLVQLTVVGVGRSFLCFAAGDKSLQQMRDFSSTRRKGGAG